ncbi:MAG: MBL fold metallo-hydrolase [Firmicutes bacterium]|nr:MBL fold metallo-hydrolase [Bacillota bacterium]
MKKLILAFWMILVVVFTAACGGETTEEEITVPENTNESELTTAPGADAPFAVHFFDVGQADSALVICDGETMLIDGGNVGDGDDVVAAIDDLGVSDIDVMISTHSDEDHIGGLPDVLENFDVHKIYADGNPADTKIYQRFCDTANAEGLDLTDPAPGESFSLGGAEVTFLGPITLASDPNANSIVLRVDYGETSFVFTGDATEKEEKDIVDAGMDLSADVLKVSHHGAAESSCYVFLREVMPDYAVISVGEGNKYGHPTDATLSRLRDVGAAVYRTDELGAIICYSDGKSLSFINIKGADMPAAEENRTDVAPSVPEEDAYVGNINSLKFHSPDCGSLPEEQNSAYFATRDEAISQGYEPCGRCKP